MWPFKKKNKAVKQLPRVPTELYAKQAGTVTKVMYDYILIDDIRYETTKPLVEMGQAVVEGQPVGKI